MTSRNEIYAIYYNPENILVGFGNQQMVDSYLSQIDYMIHDDIKDFEIRDMPEDISNHIQYQLCTYLKDIILTERECIYYDKKLKLIYDNLKTASAFLYSYNQIVDVPNIKDRGRLYDAFSIIHDNNTSFEDFTHNIKYYYLMSNIITDPITFNKMVNYENMQNFRFQYNLIND